MLLDLLEWGLDSIPPWSFLSLSGGRLAKTETGRSSDLKFSKKHSPSAECTVSSVFEFIVHWLVPKNMKDDGVFWSAWLELIEDSS
jgi:hypothetical protein